MRPEQVRATAAVGHAGPVPPVRVREQLLRRAGQVRRRGAEMEGVLGEKAA